VRASERCYRSVTPSRAVVIASSIIILARGRGDVRVRAIARRAAPHHRACARRQTSARDGMPNAMRSTTTMGVAAREGVINPLD